MAKSKAKAKAKVLPKQQRFVEEYLVDLNATQAAIRAGYSQRTAYAQGQRLLKKAEVAAAVAAAQALRSEATGITQERVLGELALLAFSDVTHYLVSETGDVALAAHAPKAAMRAVQSIRRRIITRKVGSVSETTTKIELKLWDKPGPLKLAGRHVGLFPDRVEITGKNGGPVENAVKFYLPDNGRARSR